MADALGRAETELKLDDDWLTANESDPAVFVDVVRREPLAAFLPQCRTLPATLKGRFQQRWFRIDGAKGDRTATTAYINKCLINHQEGQQVASRYACGHLHTEALRYIYPNQTTARGISIFC